MVYRTPRGKVSHVNLSWPPPPQKNPPENVCLLPKTNTRLYVSNGCKVHNLQPSPGDFGGLSRPQRHSY